MEKRMTDATQTSVGRRQFLASWSLCPLVAFAAGCATQDAENDGEESTSPLPRTTEDRVELALRRFQGGFHCSQSVLEAYAADFGLDPELARRIAAGLAGGSTVGGECGAVSAAYLVLGLRHGRTTPAYGDVEQEKELWDRVRSFVEEFESRHGALTCRELLGVDAFSREGYEEASRRKLFRTRCPSYVQDAVEILDSLG
jgi:C_GCAxxG_C_C family probable redox protein